MLETLLGSLFGGIFRIIPEVLKMLDAKNERAHEAIMLDKEMAFAKIKGEITMRQVDAAMTMSELDVMTDAIKEQGQTARAAGKFVAALSALVRPLVTYWFVVLYSLVKIASILMAIADGGDWKEVLINAWTPDDMALLMMILTLWFVGRVWERATQ